MAQENVPPKGQKSFTDQDMAVVKKSYVEQKDFRTFVRIRGKFSEEEKSTLEIDSVVAFESFWKTTLDAKGDFEASHEHGFGLVVQKTQNFAASAWDILRQLEPILEVVKTFGGPYGTLAVGTISFLFAIAKNRATIQSQISATLMQIRDRVAGLRLYRHIYNGDHELDRQLQSKIVQTYDSFVGFCMAATKYYDMGGMRRWLKAMGGPTPFKAKAFEMQKIIVDVRYMSEELLNKNVDTIKRLTINQRQEIESLNKNVHTIKEINIDQAQEIEELKARIKQLQEGHDGDRLENVKALLDLQTYSPDSELVLLKKYESDINADFDQNWPYLERMQGNRLEALKAHQDFQKWRLCVHSCMLVLVGYNNDSVWSARECWLSPLALDMIANLKKSGQADPCAFHIIGLGEPETFPQILLCIIFQLLKLNPQALHKRNGTQYANLCTAIQEYRAAIAKAGDESQKYSSETNALLQQVALGVLNMFDSTKTVWIILDRVDRCESASEINHRKKLLQRLVYLVEKAEVKVRVLAVVNGYDWRVDKEEDELGQNIPASLIIHTERQRTQD